MGGGSGGHITPLLSVARELKLSSPSCRVIYIGIKGDKFGKLTDHHSSIDRRFFIRAGKFRRYYRENWWYRIIDWRTNLLNLRDSWYVIVGTFQAARLLRDVKPDMVFIKGGFAGVPVGLAAGFGRVRFITHDSDAAAGLANKLIGRWAVVHATGMPAEFYNYPKDKIRYVGIPIDSNFKPISASDVPAAKQALGFNSHSRLVLVMGGGLGSKRVNQMFLQAAPKLFAKLPNLVVVHIAGHDHALAVRDSYKQLLGGDFDKKVRVIDFTDKLYEYSAVADLVIARAGATTLAELAAQRKACLIVPNPLLTGGHQLKNAQQLEKIGAIEMLSETAEPEFVFKVISRLLNDIDRRRVLSKSIGGVARPDAAKNIAELIISCSSDKTERSLDL